MQPALRQTWRRLQHPTVVDEFIDRVMTDPRLNANPLVDEAQHRVPPAGFEDLVKEMVCWATGGPQKYTGKSMAESHSHLRLPTKSGRHSWTIFSRRWTNSPSPAPSRRN
jgi:hemoglobin